MEGIAFISNFVGALAIGLWILKWILNRRIDKNSGVLSSAEKAKLTVCSTAKYFFALFVLMKSAIFVMYGAI
ncbi:MAG: hypothetical protein ACI4LO_00745 [Anaerovoracaceae bacterium]